MPLPNKQILDAFRERLLSAVNRSPLLKITISKTGRLLDCARLDRLELGLGTRLLEVMVGGSDSVVIDLPWHSVLSDAAASSGEDDEPDDVVNQSIATSGTTRVARQQRSIEQSLVRIIRDGKLAKRETGIHALWFGYPLLFLAVPGTNPVQQLLAPVFLWPIEVDALPRQQGRFTVKLASEVGPPQFNGAMAAWIRTKLQFTPPKPSQEVLTGMTWATMVEHLEKLGSSFNPRAAVNCDRVLEAIPVLKDLRPDQSPRIFNSAVLGLFRWQNQEILGDIEAIKDAGQCQGPVTGYVTGDALERPRTKIQPPQEADRYLVCDADFSQENVVWNARAEPGLVAHGPPGTGKSQTIVNVIADALAHGRTVLMVCQKQAATRVVLERLRKVGLENLCIEVHDPESDRVAVFKEILSQVQQLPNAVQPTSQKRRLDLARQISALKEDLDRIARGFHEKLSEVGLSFQQIKAREGRLFGAFDDIRAIEFLQSSLGGLDFRAIDDACEQARTVGQCFKEADALRNPWRHHLPAMQLTPAKAGQIAAGLATLRELDERHQEIVRKSGPGLSLPLNTLAFADSAAHLIKELRMHADNQRGKLVDNHQVANCKITRMWLRSVRAADADELQEIRERCDQAMELSAEAKRSAPNPAWDNVCSQLSPSELKQLRRANAHNCRNQWWRFFDPRYHLARRIISKKCPKDVAESLASSASKLTAYFKACDLRESLAHANRKLVPGLSAGMATKTQLNYSRLAKQGLEAAVWLREQERNFIIVTPFLNALLDPDQHKGLDEQLIELERSIYRLETVNNLLRCLSDFETYLSSEALEEPRRDILAGKSIQEWSDRLAFGFKGLPALMKLEINRRQRQEPFRTILENLENYEKCRAKGQNVPAPPKSLPDEQYGEWWAGLVNCSAVELWLQACHEACPELLDFLPENHQQKRDRLRTLISEKKKLEPMAIREQWLLRQIALRGEPWAKWFQFGGPKAKRLRQAVEQSLSALLTMRPCWLVDPGTAAQVFPLKSGLFDVVIFDEASQCPIEYAVPAIYRAKSLIVSGDAKQLPPTSFFSTKAQASEGEQDEDDDEDSTDNAVDPGERQIRQINVSFLTTVEDLLEASKGNLPEEHLLVHYRSDHPALIEFSNRAFYHGLLEAPPARVNLLSGKPPIEYLAINGVYENRTNRAEARGVLESLKTLWKAGGKSPTVGVVTFNLHQRELIQNLVEEACRADGAFNARYQQELDRKDENQDVGFFVKNLENVQGDERDVMIFSTTFGRSGNGKFIRKLGPVGAVRGERRLNVAVTRAKQQIIVVGSMPIEEISTALNAAGGPGSLLTPRCYLQLWLAYARAVSSGNEHETQRILDRVSREQVDRITSDGPDDSPLEEEVLAELEKRNYAVRCQVGESGFKIDLAVLHPDPKQGYILGIECDGATYHSGRAAHLRDVWREQILRSRGWRIHRIWSTRWWYHRAEEIEKLEEAIMRALSEHPRTN